MKKEFIITVPDLKYLISILWVNNEWLRELNLIKAINLFLFVSLNLDLFDSYSIQLLLSQSKSP